MIDQTESGLLVASNLTGLLKLCIVVDSEELLFLVAAPDGSRSSYQQTRVTFFHYDRARWMAIASAESTT